MWQLHIGWVPVIIAWAELDFSWFQTIFPYFIKTGICISSLRLPFSYPMQLLEHTQKEKALYLGVTEKQNSHDFYSISNI